MEKNTNVKGVALPFFYGFYDSPLNGSEDAIEYEIEYYRDEEGKEYDWDDFDFDYENYRKEICNCFVHMWKENHKPDWIEDIEFEELWSPRYYNFENDRCYATITLTKDWNDKIAHFCNEHHECLEKRIRKDWSCRDGFISYIENDYELFYQNLIELEPRYVSIFMGYWTLINEYGEEKIPTDMYMRFADETLGLFSDSYSDIEFVHLKSEDDTPNETDNRTTNNISES